MARFDWKAEYATDNELVDAQHRQLIEFANLFMDAAESGKERTILEQSFDMLFRYTQDHFRDEEALYAEIDSPLLNEQRAEHEQLVDEITAIRSLWQDNAFGFDAAAVQALETWIESRLLPHFFEQDREAVAGR
jgi:hemerythrin